MNRYQIIATPVSGRDVQLCMIDAWSPMESIAKFFKDLPQEAIADNGNMCAFRAVEVKA